MGRGRGSGYGGYGGCWGRCRGRQRPSNAATPPMGPAAAHFWSRLQMAARTMLAAGGAALVGLGFWAWAGQVTWFSAVLCIISMRATLGESMRVASSFWHGAALTVPLAALLGLVRHATAAPLPLLLGLFLAVALLVLHPSLPDAGKRLAIILLALVVLTDNEAAKPPTTLYLHKLAPLLLCLAMANLFTLVALLAPIPPYALPALALLEARAKVAALKGGMRAIVAGCGRAFDLGEEMHFSTIEQLLEETTQALAELQTALPNLRWELALLLLCPAPSAARTAHGRLTAYLSVMERQLEIATGLFLSLRRIWVFGPHVQNATHREFARYLRRPLNALLAAWVAASDAVAGRVQRAALGVCGGRREGGRDEDLEALLAAATARHEAFMFALLRARLAVFFGFDVEEGWEEGMLGPGLVGSSVALEEDGGGAGDNSSSSSNPPKLVAEAEEEEQQGEQGQQQGARRPPSPTPTSNPPPAPPALPTPSSSSSYYYLPPPRPPTPTANATGPPSSFQRRRPTVLAEGSEPPRAVPLKRRESSGEDGVFRRFQRDYARLGAFALLPRNTFLLDVNLLVDSLPDLVAAVAAAAPGTAGDGDGGDDKAAPPFPWAAWAWDRLITPCLALLGGAAKARREKRRGSPPPPPGSQEEAAAEEGEGGGGGGGADVPAAPAAPPPPPVSLLKRLRLPFKVALSVVLASLSFFFGTGRGAHTPWAAFAVAASMSSHPGSSFRAGVSRVQGTVVGGMMGIAAVKVLGTTTPPGHIAVIAVWTFLCAWHRASAVYGDAAVVAAFTVPIIMLGPIPGEAGVTLRVEQTVLGTVIYAVVDSLVYPVRAKVDLRRELAAALDTLRGLWRRSFDVFLRRAPAPLEAAAGARALHGRLQASLVAQGRYLDLALLEPQLWHKPFQAAAYRKMADALARTSLYLAMLVRASNAFPPALTGRDAAYHDSLLRAVAGVERATADALTQAWQAVRGLSTTSGRRKDCAATEIVRSQACALLRLDDDFQRLRESIDVLMVQHIQTTRTTEGAGGGATTPTTIVSPHFILSISGMLFSIEALGRALLRVGHALRGLVERETRGARRDCAVVLEEEEGV